MLVNKFQIIKTLLFKFKNLQFFEMMSKTLSFVVFVKISLGNHTSGIVLRVIGVFNDFEKYFDTIKP